MAYSQRYLHSISRGVQCSRPQFLRGFSTSSIWAEDEVSTTSSPRAQARRDAAQAVQQLAHSRASATGGPTIRRVADVSQSDGIIRRGSGTNYRSDTRTASSDRARTSSDRSGPPRTSFDRSSSSRGTFRGARTSSSESGSPQRSWGPRSGPSQRGSGDSRGGVSRARGGSSRGGKTRGSFRDRRSRDSESGGYKGSSPSSLLAAGELESPGESMTIKDEFEVLESIGYERKWTIKPAQGPHLDMAGMLMEYAPRHFGATEPVKGEYPAMTDDKRRGLMQDIVRQVRKNETYTEKDIEQLTKKLGPMMPRA